VRIVAAISVILLLYTWFAYPLAVALLARLRPRRRGGPPSLAPSVSVVIATRGPDEAIDDRVRDVLRTGYPPDRLEVLVSCDATRAGAPYAPGGGLETRVRVVRGDEPGGKAATLNAGVRAAGGEILVFTDTAQRFDVGTIGALVGALVDDARLGAVSGALHLEPGDDSGRAARLYWRFERWLRQQEARLHSAVGVTGAVYAMRRTLWQALPPGLILDDLHTPMRLVLEGYHIGFVEEAVAHDPRRFTAAEEARRRVRTLTGVLQLVAWLPAVLSPLRNPIWLEFVSHKLLRLLTPYLIATLIIAAGMAAAADVPAAWLGWTLLVIGATAAILLASSANVRRTVAGVALMLGAVVRASLNAARGQWDVWQP
jgi:cellulose synthase/poly-beta-1,6-N-acetylglucosamine synthase-like glycosyltransferase